MPKWLLLEEAAVLKSSLFAASYAGFCSKRGFAAGRPLCEWRPQEPAEPEASPSVPGLCGFCLGLAAFLSGSVLEAYSWVPTSWWGSRGNSGSVGGGNGVGDDRVAFAYYTQRSCIRLRVLACWSWDCSNHWEDLREISGDLMTVQI